MAYREDIGRVVGDKGEDGATYVPSVADIDVGEIQFSFTNSKDSTQKEQISIKLPYYVPVIRTYNGKPYITFTLTPSDGEQPARIDLEDLKGEPGEVGIEFVSSDYISNANLDNAKLGTLYYVDNDNTYVVQETITMNNETVREWKNINRLIDLSQYATIAYVTNAIDTLQQEYEAKLATIINQTQSINNILMDGLSGGS